MSIAEKMASNQKQIAISEFFEKNKHFLGFDTLNRAIITAVKEAVDTHLMLVKKQEFYQTLLLKYNGFPNQKTS